jgi:hypothetical protein
MTIGKTDMPRNIKIVATIAFIEMSGSIKTISAKPGEANNSNNIHIPAN